MRRTHVSTVAAVRQVVIAKRRVGVPPVSNPVKLDANMARALTRGNVAPASDRRRRRRHTCDRRRRRRRHVATVGAVRKVVIANRRVVVTAGGYPVNLLLYATILRALTRWNVAPARKSDDNRQQPHPRRPPRRPPRL